MDKYEKVEIANKQKGRLGETLISTYTDLLAPWCEKVKLEPIVVEIKKYCKENYGVFDPQSGQDKILISSNKSYLSEEEREQFYELRRSNGWKPDWIFFAEISEGAHWPDKCPNCGSTRVYSRKKTKPTYRCQECKETFEIPANYLTGDEWNSMNEMFRHSAVFFFPVEIKTGEWAELEREQKKAMERLGGDERICPLLISVDIDELPDAYLMKVERIE